MQGWYINLHGINVQTVISTKPLGALAVAFAIKVEIGGILPPFFLQSA